MTSLRAFCDARLVLERYNPNERPDAELWLGLDEDERRFLISEYVEAHEPAVGPALLHAHIHLAVENQAALGDETPVAEAIERLTGEGLSRHDAIHAVGTCLANLFVEGGSGGEMSQDTYFDDVRKLTAEKWRAMWEEG